MAGRRTINVVFSYSHKDEDHHRRLAEHLGLLKEDRSIDNWDDRSIPAGADWSQEITDRFADADIILLLLSSSFLESRYVAEKEIPQALGQAATGKSVLVPVILAECAWKDTELSRYEAIPLGAPIVDWPNRDVAYAEVARGVAATADSLRAGIYEQVEVERKRRVLRIFRQYPFRILGEDYDPFRAFEQVFRRVETRELLALPPLPLADRLGSLVDFQRKPALEILDALRFSQTRVGLPYDLVAIPYWMLGHCVASGLIQPLGLDTEPSTDFLWWREMGEFEGHLYGVPLSALTMILAIRRDLFDQYGLTPPDSWEDYVNLVDHMKNSPVRDREKKTVAPSLLQGQHHITIWYEWLNHLYAHGANDRELYGGNRYIPKEAAATLEGGTLAYLSMVEKLAPYADGVNLPHYATANWDDGLDCFAQGRLLMHFVFNDALYTLRKRIEASSMDGIRPRIEYLPVPRSYRDGQRHGQVEGWILCIPAATKYTETANAILDWFLDVEVQRAYSSWGGASAHRLIVDREAQRTDDGGAGKAFKESVDASVHARASVDLVKYKKPEATSVIDRTQANLYSAILSVAKQRMSVEVATQTFLRDVAERLR